MLRRRRIGHSRDLTNELRVPAIPPVPVSTCGVQFNGGPRMQRPISGDTPMHPAVRHKRGPANSPNAEPGFSESGGAALFLADATARRDVIHETELRSLNSSCHYFSLRANLGGSQHHDHEPENQADDQSCGSPGQWFSKQRANRGASTGKTCDATPDNGPGGKKCLGSGEE